jgi:hypothetical protein
MQQADAQARQHHRQNQGFRNRFSWFTWFTCVTGQLVTKTK